MTLEKGSRDAIGRVVRSLRGLFEEEFGKQASGRFGIRSFARSNASELDGLDGWLDPVESLSLTPVEFAQRDELIRALRYLTSEGAEPGEAVARLIREAAFTAVNRLLAIRVAEAIGVLPAVLSAGRQSPGYRDTVGDLFPGLDHDDDGYWIYVQVAGDELAPGVPRLFDRRHPTSAFIPSRACVDEALELLTADELAVVWGEPETLGWGYQFFNGDDVKQMRDASSAPRNSRELAVRNQFFTPRYVVDWLVQNTLGRRLVQAGYELELPLLVGEVGDHAPLELDHARVLDPAVGSGHFLLGSYDLLERAWQSVGVPPEEAAGRILPCLFGVDIDPRAAQVAQAVLLLRARRSAPDADLTPPSIVTAVALPRSKALREQVFGRLDPAAQVAARDVAEALDQAPLLGTLLRVEQRLDAELAGSDTAPRLTDGDATAVLDDLHGALDQLVSTATSPEERMFTAEASDALRFLDISRQRYDAVLMNPPFGSSPREVGAYLKKHFAPGKNDLYSAFVMRGHELLARQGYVGALTNRTGFFLSSFEDWRRWLIASGIRTVADLGSFVLEDAQVEVAAYVVGSAPTQKISFANLLHTSDKSGALRRGDFPSAAIEAKRLQEAPKAIFAYWLGSELLSLFSDLPAVEESGIKVSRGLSTGDNFRFIRLAWEIPAHFFVEGWKPLVKGGEFARYWASPHLALDWHDPEQYNDVEGARIFNLDQQGRRGVFWTKRTTLLVSSRALPDGVWFEANSIPAFADGIDPHLLLSWTNSRIFTVLFLAQMGAGDLARGSAAKDWISGPARRIPFKDPSVRTAAELIDLARQAMQLARDLEARDETSPFFDSPVIVQCGGETYRDRARHASNMALAREAQLMEVHEAAQRIWERDVYGLSDKSIDVIDAWTEGLVSDGRETIDPDVARAALKALRSTDSVHLEEVPDDRRLLDRAAKQSSPRTLEDVARIFRANPSALVATWESETHDPWNTDQLAMDVLSYLMGRAFGRWSEGDDHPRLDSEFFTQFDSNAWLRRLSRRARTPEPGRLLIDDPGSPRDVIQTLHEVAASIPEIGIEGWSWIEHELGDLRELLRNRFYPDHLARYSRSRRKAPVYWYLCVPSRSWGMWLPYHDLDREMLYAVGRAAQDKHAAMKAFCGQLSDVLASGSDRRETREQLERAESLLDELQSFSSVAKLVAESGWSPDLSDGIVLNAGPLEPLIADTAWRREVAKHRKAMQKGDYPWATVQREYFEKRT